ncbi:MAG: alanine--tRNA ligase, partial [Leptospira sp.]|nr:alanine--tRNA ligase [Leptospira sp.]
NIYKEEYPELGLRQKEVERILHGEETLFWNTLELGLNQLSSLVEDYTKSGRKIFSGKDSFRLYGTYGFPPEMTEEILKDSGIEFDRKNFEIELDKDRSLSRESWKGKNVTILTGTDKALLKQTRFLGFTENISEANILFLFKDMKQVSQLSTGESGVLILDSTPFYAEAGGQLGDTGFIKNENGIFQVTDTQKENDVYLHIGVVLKGTFSGSSPVQCEIDLNRRELLTYHHSGTHLLNGALRSILGLHVSQKASLVAPDHLRFDFSHPEPLTNLQISEIEKKVNLAIQNEVTVKTEVMPIAEARKTKAVSMFDEKYGEVVRVVGMGDYSTEFCGGCHVGNTSDIRYFSIIKESSPGAGNRRIEAICGPPVRDYFQLIFQNLSKKVQDFNLKAKDVYPGDSSKLIAIKIPVPEEIDGMFSSKGSTAVDNLRKLKEEIEISFEEKNSKLIKDRKKIELHDLESSVGSIDELLKSAMEIGGITIVRKNFKDSNMEALRGIGDKLKGKNRKTLVLFAIESGDSVAFLFMATKSAVEAGVHCGDLMRTACEMTNGRGGGKPDMAQGGGKDPGRTEDALRAVENLIRKNLGE